MPAHQPVSRNKAGFTLVEVLIAMLVLAIGLLCSLVGVKAALDSNLNNLMREEAIKLAQERAEEARNMPYTSIQNIVTPQTINRTIRKSTVPYTVTTGRQAAVGYGTSEMTKLTITIAWALKGKNHSYSMETVVRQKK